jgi:anti-sigma B factor antagonist
MGSRRSLVAMLKAGEVMELNLTTRVLGEKTVVDCVGSLVYGAEATALRQLVKDLIAQGKKEIVLDLSGVRHVDSGGLGIVAGLHTSAQHAGSHIRLANPTARTAKLLYTTNLATVFDVSGIDTGESATSNKSS